MVLYEALALSYFLPGLACKNIHYFLNELLKLILYLPSKIDLWAYFYSGFSLASALSYS
jgi:hypothetical protein